MKNLVVLTGAGISAESGLKTFRDSDGLWEGYNINEVATATAWRKNPGKVLAFYNLRRQGVAAAQPNKAHRLLAALEEDFQVHIITQNIDDLHERGGSSNVLHLHGEIFKMRSEKSELFQYPIQGDIKLGEKAEDGAQLRPHIVWFEEPVPAMEAAIALVQQADIFMIIGTSLQVYPAAGLLHYAPPSIPKIIIDKKIPQTYNIKNLTAFENMASNGLEEAMGFLKSLQ